VALYGLVSTNVLGGQAAYTRPEEEGSFSHKSSSTLSINHNPQVHNHHSHHCYNLKSLTTSLTTTTHYFSPSMFNNKEVSYLSCNIYEQLGTPAQNFFHSYVFHLTG